MLATQAAQSARAIQAEKSKIDSSKIGPKNQFAMSLIKIWRSRNQFKASRSRRVNCEPIHDLSEVGTR